MDKNNPENSLIAALSEAATIAQRFGAVNYNTFHILLSLLKGEGFVRDFLEQKGVSINQLLLHAQDEFPPEPFLGNLIGRVRQIAQTANLPRQPIHLLYAILSFGEESHARRLLREFLDPEVLQREIISSGYLRQPPDYKKPGTEKEAEKTPLQIFGIDYTQMAKEGKLKPAIGRDDEIMAIVEILARKDAGIGYDEAINNPVLLGEAGVGKTALAKSLATMIARRDEKVRLFWNHRLVYISLGSLQAGTGIRGTLESKVEAILKECKEGPATILFLDELHIVMGLGKTEGSSGLEEILKPVLAEGLSCIGATTTGEWRKRIETKNAAFARRWITLTINEPSPELTLQILTGCVDILARRHLVHFSGEVLGATVELARKFIAYENSPHREIEVVLNGVGAKVKLTGRTKAEVSDVVNVIAQTTGLPISTSTDERNKISRALEILNYKIIGQEKANRALADAIIRFKSGMTDPKKPMVVLSLGPTGVGKTLSARTLADEFYFGRLIRIDMSEYMEKHTVSRLIGSPPGYIGYDEPGQLTEQIRRLGIAVVLIDEIEKAHPDVLQIFLQLFDEGRLTDNKGNTVDAKQCIFIMTSNVGNRLYGKAGQHQIGFHPVNNPTAVSTVNPRDIIAEAKKILSLELINRIDETIVYQPLTPEAVRSIAELLLIEEKVRCSQKGFLLNWDEAVIDYLMARGFSATLGARPMKRQIMKHIQTLLAGPVFTGEIAKGDTIHLTVEGTNISFRKENS
ncbi:MAG: ATP-dependent Clp protease ATP-binding subunit [Candidatus Buchananbacteria bacterium]|nr:ATP-dependent Clp protease ATP-binding subunit [Candidatus Buchananbacteria bacterium]